MLPLQALDSHLSPRLAGLMVWAVEQLESVYLLPVTNSITAGAEGVVSRDGHSYVERRKQCTALLVAGNTGQAAEADSSTSEAAAAASEEGVDAPTASAADEAAASTAENEPGAASAKAAAASSSAAAAATAITAAAAAVSPVSPVSCALYVAQPDSLIECSTQVARELGGWLAGLGLEAGLHQAINPEPLVVLLEKLLMVQVRENRKGECAAVCQSASASCLQTCAPLLLLQLWSAMGCRSSCGL